MEWIITAKPTGQKGYKIIEASEELPYIDWHKSKVLKNIMEGDVVYIYVGKPYMKIMFKMLCLQSVVNPDETEEDSKYFNDPSRWEKPKECFRIKKEEEIFDDSLSLHNLNELGLVKGNIQGSFKSDNFPELFSYIREQFMTHAKNTYKLNEKDIELTSEVVFNGIEGRKIGYYTTKYERQMKNRNKAIKVHGSFCKTCGFDFSKVYGEFGKGFIEVHHTKPLFTLNEEVYIDPQCDLVCLCSNCHKMIHHKKNSILTVEELTEIIEKNKR